MIERGRNGLLKGELDEQLSNEGKNLVNISLKIQLYIYSKHLQLFAPLLVCLLFCRVNMRKVCAKKPGHRTLIQSQGLQSLSRAWDIRQCRMLIILKFQCYSLHSEIDRSHRYKTIKYRGYKIHNKLILFDIIAAYVFTIFDSF